MPLVLASTSPWRIKMLADAGVRCEGMAPPVNEAAIVNADPVVMARLRAEAKASSVAALRPDATVIGADQVCWLPGAPPRVFHKPTSAEEHLDQLRVLAGRTHTLSTAVTVVHRGVPETHIEHSHITLRALPDAELAGYVASGEGRACAGGYQVEATGAWLIERVDGDAFNVVGLPLFALLTLLRRSGATPPFIP